MHSPSPESFSGVAVRTIIVFLTLLDSLPIRAADLATYCAATQTTFGPAELQMNRFVETSYDPIKTFNDPNTLAATLFAMQGRLDGMLRVGSAVSPSPVCMWINGDYGEQKGRNYLEGGMSTQFEFRKNARYPLIVTIPASMAAGEEEYAFGPAFGYVTAGVSVRVPLSFIPSRYGQWTAGSSADLCYYGTTTSEFLKSVGLGIPKIAAAFSVD